jgi:hypothetical protein
MEALLIGIGWWVFNLAFVIPAAILVSLYHATVLAIADASSSSSSIP